MLSARVRRAAEQHASHTVPRESCGLVIVEAGRQVYVPCTNVAESDGYFSLPAREYAAAEDRGEIVAIVHSHPDGGAEPSEADLDACAASGLPWAIVAVPEIEWRFIQPDSIELLAGARFSPGITDCATVVGEWYRREGPGELPPFPRAAITSFSCHAFLSYLERTGFRPVAIEAPRVPGDLVLMQVRGDEPDHLGVIDAAGRLCHHLAGRLSSRDLYDGKWSRATRNVYRLSRML